ncbi:MAG: DUF6666 family protein [Pirellulales bacterium]|nr:DUF6666 family protein [Pirellulales bacterium]
MWLFAGSLAAQEADALRWRRTSQPTGSLSAATRAGSFSQESKGYDQAVRPAQHLTGEPHRAPAEPRTLPNSAIRQARPLAPAAGSLSHAAERYRLANQHYTRPATSTYPAETSQSRTAGRLQAGAKPIDRAAPGVPPVETVPTPLASQSPGGDLQNPFNDGGSGNSASPSSPFDPNFPEARPLPRENAAPANPPMTTAPNSPQRGTGNSVLKSPPRGSANELPELPGEIEVVPAPYGMSDEPHRLDIDPTQDWQDAMDGCADCQDCGGTPGGDYCDSCAGDCAMCGCGNGPCGHRHPRLRRLRHGVRMLMHCIVGGCDPCDHGPFGCDPTPTCGGCCGWYWDQDLTLQAGVQGFKGPLDRGVNGNFGFSEGFNWGSPLWCAQGIGFQFGGLATQTNLNESESFSQDRQQYYLTTGLYRRQMDGYGWQYGVVYDQLFDTFDQDIEVAQVRGELSFLFERRELGFMFSSNVQTDQIEGTSSQRSYQTLEQYAFFIRQRTFMNGEARLFAGFTDNSEGIFGGDFRLPISPALALQSQFNYIAPQDSETNDQEAWNVGLSLVWYLGNDSTCAGHSRFRPLFNVADNSSLIVR